MSSKSNLKYLIGCDEFGASQFILSRRSGSRKLDIVSVPVWGFSSWYKKKPQNKATCIRPPHLPKFHRCCAGSPHFILLLIILVLSSRMSRGQSEASTRIHLDSFSFPLTCIMAGGLCTTITSGWSNPANTTITHETTVTYSAARSIEMVTVAVCSSIRTFLQ
jgi:hypothetical protein